MILPPPADHGLRCSLAQEERRAQVHRKRLVEGFRPGAQERLAKLDAGVVDQDIEAAEALDGRPDQPRLLVQIANIGGQRQRLASRRANLAHHLVGRAVGTRVVYHHGGALASQPDRQRAANAAVAAGYDRHPIR